MRITNSMMVNTTLMNLNSNLSRLDFYNKQFSTTKKFTLPSEDPVGTSKSLTLHTAVAELKQNKETANDVISFLEITESAIEDIGNVLQRARELAVSADGTETKEDKQKIQAEMDQLKEQLIKLGNTTYAGKYVFSGYKTDKELFDKDGKYNIALADDEKMNYKIGIADEVTVNTLGHKLFGVGPGDQDKVNTTTEPKVNDSAQLIELFQDLSTALKEDKQDDINKILGRIDQHHENILAVRGELGAKYNRMEMTMKRIDRDIINFTGLLSKNEDADMAQVSIDLKTAESVYRASLAAGSKVIQPSLVDFIR
ncbi:flagellar hook-associated protein FlgL [Inediibacterium massiliense]|uniref:flagellar hook-associated protein FlgL n=1 Tax=Inediibacterium massiliense TaxID=1658111 RepID=UPI0006B6904F|nr:flagellar hook-associated protein FlgL [Inediibacterium massiliense]